MTDRTDESTKTNQAVPARSAADDDPAGIRSVKRAGLIVIVVFFGIFGGWAWFAPLQNAAIAPGILIVETNRKTIQSLEGGIVAEILVREGDRVGAGEPLLRLERTQALASRDLFEGRQIDLLAREARLIAERDGADEIDFPDELVASTDRSRVADVMRSQRELFKSRRATLEQQRGILKQKMAQLREEIQGLEDEIASDGRRIELLQSEIADIRDLVEKGLARRPRLLALERALEEISGNVSRNRAAVARARQAIGEAELQISELLSVRRNDVLEELRSVQAELTDNEEQLRTSQDVLDRTEIASPIEGTVVDLKVHTLGGVIAPGEPLMDIVPVNDRLVVEARINPRDIDVVKPGLPAHVRLTALSQRNELPLEGSLASVSADLLQDEASNIVYYLGRIELAPEQLERAGAPRLYPGMQAEVMIVTDAITPMEYLLRPISRSLRRAMRDS